ncbi:hypothetical protein [Companilactobacillus sp. DQM5]|uniref:hypothetical protein n=1 Tax=Companilactobacillus sp. DQM5 TaxID=3463359 RepID=UPI004058F4B8
MNNFEKYIEQVIKLSKKFEGIDEVDKRIELILNFDNALSKNIIPDENLYSLVFSEEEILLILQKRFNLESLEELDRYLSYFRQYLQESYGYWATITKPFLNSFLDTFKFDRCLELMAGNAYISKYFFDKNKLVYPTDSNAWSSSSNTGKKQLIDVEKIDALDAFEKYYDKVDIIMLAWSPDFDEIDYQILQRYRKIKGDKPLFFIIGEIDGATNSDKFWGSVNIKESSLINKVNGFYSNYDIVDDHLYLIG